MDEQGLWQQYERVEQEIAGSNLLIKESGADGLSLLTWWDGS
jgi:hypothetical protein